ncbi:PcfB family protein [Flavonifractor plautii]|uniref:PcfB family protein n=1 Tax=Flavonifractor plautii TaxID=292800 RepID=UPI001106E7D8|nr:PcfB family protein [Flavonifractor plautii]MDB7894558.1 DUF3801 domain-containing protein [Flavonifractor plautii]
MSYSGDAAEQVVRMSLETGEVAVRLAGSGAKQLAILIYAILREQKKTAGKARLTNMLRSGKELKVFAVKDSDLQLFCREAKKYGVLYCVLKDRDATDGLTDIMARAEDAGKINRIIERFGLATVDMAQVKQEIEQSRAERRMDAPETPAAEPAAGVDTPQGPMTEREMDGFLDAMLAQAPKHGPAVPERDDPDRDLDEFLKAARGASSGREEDRTENPTVGRTEKSRLSEPTSKLKEAAEPGVPDPLERPRPSVRQALKEIRAEQKQRAEEKARENAGRQKPIQHKAPPKKKVRKQKER